MGKAPKKAKAAAGKGAKPFGKAKSEPGGKPGLKSTKVKSPFNKTK